MKAKRPTVARLAKIVRKLGPTSQVTKRQVKMELKDQGFDWPEKAEEAAVWHDLLIDARDKINATRRSKN